MRRLIVIISAALALGIAGCAGEPTPTPMPTSPPSPTASATPSPTATPVPTNTPIPTPSPTASPTLVPTVTPTPTPPPLSEIARSTVKIEAYVEQERNLVLAWQGSGTIVTADGQILTNAHVVVGADELKVSLISDPDHPPTPMYYAEPLVVDCVLDLALVQITTDLKGNEVVPGELDLPALELGNSDAIAFGQGIRILGYPGFGGETVTLTDGTVSGFESEDLGYGSERFWIKSDADLDGGVSGGTAVDDQGRLVGIPSAYISRGGGPALGRVRPINLATNYTLLDDCAPFVCNASIYEPNDALAIAYGPLDSETPYSAYLHHYDTDVYRIEVGTLAPIEIDLSDIPDDTDYDLGLLDVDGWLLAASEGETSSERIIYSPEFTGTHYIVVVSFEGYSLQQPYVLQFGSAPPLVRVTGRLLDANTGRPIGGAAIALLLPEVTGQQFVDNGLSERLTQTWTLTDAEGVFVLEDVPQGRSYTLFIATETDFFWEDDWLTIPREEGLEVVELGDLTVSPE
jgi:S1-C subfamily serine protease